MGAAQRAVGPQGQGWVHRCDQRDEPCQVAQKLNGEKQTSTKVVFFLPPKEDPKTQFPPPSAGAQRTPAAHFPAGLSVCLAPRVVSLSQRSGVGTGSR